MRRSAGRIENELDVRTTGWTHDHCIDDDQITVEVERCLGFHPSSRCEGIAVFVLMAQHAGRTDRTVERVLRIEQAHPLARMLPADVRPA
jgi:hypothetical protein